MNKAATQSEVYSSELNCLSAVRENTKLVVGSGEGILYLFNQVEKILVLLSVFFVRSYYELLVNYYTSRKRGLL